MIVIEDILDIIFSFVNGTNYFYVNKLFYNVVKKRIKQKKTQICLDFLNDDTPYLIELGNIYDIDLSHNKEIFDKNCHDFINISMKNHDEIYNYIFNNLPKEFYIAGGSLVGILKWNTVDRNKYKLSDIDLFYIGKYENAQMDIYNAIMELKKIDNSFKIKRTKYTISLYHSTFRKIQFILHIYNSLNELFSFFDFDVVCLAYHDEKILCSFNTARMLNYNLITMDYDYRYIFMEQLRCNKYCKKNFDILLKKQLPYYDIYFYDEQNNYNTNIFKKIDENHYSVRNKSHIYYKTYILKLNSEYKNPFREMSMMCNNKIKKKHEFAEYISQVYKTTSEMKNYNLNNISNVHDKVQEYEENIFNKSDNIETYTEHIYFIETEYDKIETEYFSLDKIKTTNKFEINHLNIRYLIYICEKCGKYYYKNNHIC